MADDLTLQSSAPATPAANTVARTDQLGTGQHVPYGKIMDGTADGTAVMVVTASGAAKVDGSAVTQPVSIASAVPVTDNSGSLTVDGTVAATQSGTWTVQPGNTANTTAWKVDGSAVTQPVSAASLPLPSGASTAAKQPALGTAGAASTDVLTVQGIAAMTALKVDGSAVTQPVSAASLPLPSGASTAAKQPALGTAGSASTDVLTVQGIASMTALKVDGSAVTQPVSGTVTANIGTSGSLALDATLTGGTQKSKLVDSGGTNVATVSAGGALKVDGSAATQPVSGTVTATVGVKAYLWQTSPTSRSTALTTELNSLGNGSYSSAGTAFDNTSNSDQYAAADISLNTVNPTAGAYLTLFLLQSLDGTNYEDAPSSTNPGTHMIVATVTATTGSATKRIMTPWFRIPPGKFKFVLYNGLGAALNASSNTVTIYTDNDEAQ